MKRKLFVAFFLVLAVTACSGASNSPAAIPTVVLAGGNASTPLTGSSLASGAAASGVLVADQEARMAFELAGNVRRVNVRVGDRVQSGQVLVELANDVEQIRLEQAQLALAELTSASALAEAQEAVAKDKQDLYSLQISLNNINGQRYNPALITDARAGLVLAEQALRDAQEVYNSKQGDPEVNPSKALAYQVLYKVQKDYDRALYLFNVYSGKPNQAVVDEATAKVALAEAILAEDETLVAALTGGELPENPSGAGYARLMQAKLDVQTAQANLDATSLVAPFSGEVAAISVSAGDYVSPGQIILIVGDISHMHVETTDLSERDVPRVQLDQSATVSITALNQNVTGKVSAISPLADTLGGDVVYLVIVTLDENSRRSPFGHEC